jgi:hypothetical protein
VATDNQARTGWSNASWTHLAFASRTSRSQYAQPQYGAAHKRFVGSPGSEGIMKSVWFVAALWLGITLPAEAGITIKAWGGVGGKGVDLFTLTNANGMQASITNYGAIITAIRVPGRDGRLTDVVQGFDSLADYTSYDYKGRYGATIGRFANRIKDNTYQIKNVRYRMGRDAYVLNEAENKPYDERVWDAAPKDSAEPQLELSLLDRNGTMGFPGNLHVTVTYTLTRNNILRIA